MALAKSVIVGNVEGLADIAKGAGLLFQPGDEKELARLIVRVKDNQIYAEEIATACFHRAEEYDVEETVDRLIEIYKSFEKK